MANKWLRSATCVAAVILAWSLGVRAAERPAAGQAPDPVARFEELQKRVMEMLNDEQKPKAEKLFAEARKHLDVLKAELEKADAQRRDATEKFVQATQGLRQELQTLLNDEQLAKLRLAMGGARNAAGAMLERVQENLKQLDLSPEQQEKLMAVREKAREKFEKIREETQGDRQAMAQKLRELMQDVREEIRGILTPEQAERLQKMMDEQGGPGAGAAPQRRGADR